MQRLSSDRVSRFAQGLGTLVPDATSASVILLLIVAAAALAFGNTFTAIADAYYRGLWMLLPFTMQMTLILVLSTVVSGTPLFRRLVVAPGAVAAHPDPGDCARRGAGRRALILLLGPRPRARAAHRDPLQRGGGREGHSRRLSVPARHDRRRPVGLAVRPLGERAAPDGDAGPFPAGHGRRDGPADHHLVGARPADGDHLPRRSDPGRASADAAAGDAAFALP